MNLKNKVKQDSILLIISSFNQLINCFSFFFEKKLFIKKKIYLIILSSNIPKELILSLIKFIKKFTLVQVVYIRQNSIKSDKKFFNLKLFKLIFYYFSLLQKISKIKKLSSVSYVVSYSKIQFSTLLIMILNSSCKFIFLEDGLVDYVFTEKINFKKKILHFFFKKFIDIKRTKIKILQLANSNEHYKGFLGKLLFKKKFYYNNIENYKKFIQINFNSKNKLNIKKTKCIIVGTKVLPQNFKYYKDMYIKISHALNKKYSLSKEEIIFFAHPREKKVYLEKFKNSLSNILSFHNNFSSPIEKHIHQTNFDTIIIGSPSTSLIYAKTIFKKKNVYYFDTYINSKDSYKLSALYNNLFKSLRIKKIHI